MKEFDEILSVIENDKLSGSISLVDRMVHELIGIAKRLNPAQQREIILDLGSFIDRKPFFHAFQHLLGLLKTSKDWSASLEDYKMQSVNSILNLTNNFISLIGGKFKTYLLHSNSKTIVNVFEGLRQQSINATILQTFSNPGGEGVIQGNHLSSMGFPLTMVGDSLSDSALEKIDMFVSGADAILKNEIINKVGTRALAEKFRAIGKPYIVLADTRKFISDLSVKLPPEFEFVPRFLISRIITN